MRNGSFLASLTTALADTVPDADLLRRFADDGDGAAFELLVRRYAGVVWAACRAVLPTDRHAAEDAFQATFLVLARKAGALRAETVAGFLYRVAFNAARRVKKRAPTSGAMPDERPAPPIADPLVETEQAVAVAEEVALLAEKFRLPVLLCFFDGCTHTEAAARLGWSVGTVASRLSRAKDRLRVRLTRRGFALPAVAAAAVPIGAVRAAVETTATPSAVSPAVAELTREVLAAMMSRTTKLLWAAGLILAVAGTPVLVGALAGDPNEEKKGGQPVAKQPAADRGLPPTEFPDIRVKEPKQVAKGEERTEEERDEDLKQFAPPEMPKPLPADKPVVRLAKAKLKAVAEAQRRFLGRVNGGINTAGEFVNYVDLAVSLTAAADLAFEKPADRLKWYEHRLLLMKMSEEYYAARSNARDPLDSPDKKGIDPPYLLPFASVARLDAEIALVKLKELIGK